MSFAGPLASQRRTKRTIAANRFCLTFSVRCSSLVSYWSGSLVLFTSEPPTLDL